MACNCIATMESGVTSQMTALNAGSEVIESVTVQNKQYDVDLLDYRMYAPIEGRYKINSRIKKFESRIVLTYCPFCGTKY